MYWRVTGSGQKPVERRDVVKERDELKELVRQAEDGLRGLVEKFADPATPYLSQPRAEVKPHFSDYDHLARIKEWGLSADDDGEAA